MTATNEELAASGFSGPRTLGGFIPARSTTCGECGAMILLDDAIPNPAGEGPEFVERGVYLHSLWHLRQQEATK